MKAKELKQAKVFQVELDKIRPLTFDFNTLSELQELGYEDPFEAIVGMESMNLKAIKSLFYASLMAGQLAENEDVDFDLSINKVGNLLGQKMQFDNEAFQVLSGILGQAVADFFPEPEVKDEEEAEAKEEDPKN
ncbi:hypothetical protein Q5O89_16885 [Peribacillus frigoritolerans]|nr:hypothetical protein [Peribacillus frigoritolerans]